MAVKYTIQSSVVSIIDDIPKTDDAFLIDTNVWFWMTYTKAMTNSYQLNDYPPYLKKAMSAGAKIYYCGLTFAELAHLIEKTEREIYEKTQACTTSKEYRHNFPDQHKRVFSEIQVVWNQVQSMAEPLSITIDSPTTHDALLRFENGKVDGYDLFILECMKKHGITNIITDDGDFVTISGIKVFTANKNALKAAQQQQKIIKR